MMNDERVLWTVDVRGGTVQCVMVSCCSGAELQVRQGAGTPDHRIVLRELYPTKSDLYERARVLAAEYGAA